MNTAPKAPRDGEHAAARALFRDLARSLQQMRERYRLTRELEALSAEDRQRVLDEMRISQSDLDHFKTAGPEELLPRMMTEFGMDPASIRLNNRDVLHDMQRVCGSCTSQRRCRRMLAAGASLQEYRALCPNAGTFDGMREATGAD